MNTLKPIFIATSNPGKLRDFAGAAALFNIEVCALPNFASLPEVVEDGATFEANARKKAETYSRHAAGQIVLADDSGLEVASLGNAPGVRSARYAADSPCAGDASLSQDEANNARLLRELKNATGSQRGACFICVLAAARDGVTLQVFTGEVRGIILHSPRGLNGFGYDPLFFVPEIGKTTAELSAQEKAAVSHRGRAFKKFLEWYKSQYAR